MGFHLEQQRNTMELSEGRLEVITLPRLSEELGIHSKSIKRLVTDAGFPAPIRLTKQLLAFYRHEVNEWLKTRPRAY